MADYCTQSEMEARFGAAMLVAVSDRADAPTGTIDTALISRAIADAGALIDGHLKTLYALPVPAIPPLLRDLALRIAIYYAHSDVASEKITADYKDALKILTQISAGIVKLDIAGAEPASSGAGGVRTNEPDRPFSPSAMKGYI